MTNQLSDTPFLFYSTITRFGTVRVRAYTGASPLRTDEQWSGWWVCVCVLGFICVLVVQCDFNRFLVDNVEVCAGKKLERFRSIRVV